MSIVKTLLSAQRRPEAEALRVTEAIAGALDDPETGAGAEAYTAAMNAFSRANSDIAREKEPPPAAPDPEHRQRFEDPGGTAFTDAEDDTDAPSEHRSDPHYMLTDDDIELVDEPAEDEAGEPWQAPARVPWSDDATLRSRGIGLAGGSEHRTPGQSSAETTDPGDDQLADPGVPPTGDADLDPEPDPEADTDLEPDTDTDTDPGEPWEPPVEDNVRAARARTPIAPMAAWEADAAAARSGSPWGDAEELIPTEMVSPPAASPGDDDAYTPAPSTPPARPRTDATAAPTDIADPDADPVPSLSERLRLRLARVNLGKHPWIKVAGIAAAVVVLVVVVVMSFSGGGRGKPPQPAGTVAAPPTATENPPAPAAEDVTLVPATVEASCGNDSDAVAPFTGDKTRAWICDRINGLDLNVLNITFAQPVVITSITVVPGFNYIAPDGRDEWSCHRLVSSVSWRMGGKIYPQELTPTRTGITTQFPNVITQEMSMTITGSIRPPLEKNADGSVFGNRNDADDPTKIDETTAISSIVIKGHPVDPGAALTPGS